MSRCFLQCRESILCRSVLTPRGQGLHRQSRRCLHTYLSLIFSQVPRHHQPRNQDKGQARNSLLSLPLLPYNHPHLQLPRKTNHKHQHPPVLSPFQQASRKALHPQNRVSGRPGFLLIVVVLFCLIFQVPLTKRKKRTQPRTTRLTTQTTCSFLRMSLSGRNQTWLTGPVRPLLLFRFQPPKMVSLTSIACRPTLRSQWLCTSLHL